MRNEFPLTFQANLPHAHLEVKSADSMAPSTLACWGYPDRCTTGEPLNSRRRGNDDTDYTRMIDYLRVSRGYSGSQSGSGLCIRSDTLRFYRYAA